jgi:CMP-N,N'-diacetyllegionaminic acid synthase
MCAGGSSVFPPRAFPGDTFVIDGQRVLAIIPARAGSKGLPGKNIRPLAGKPLLAWAVEAACGAALVDDVIVSTDSQDFADVAAAHGASVPFLRPAELASDTAPSIGYIIHALETLAEGGNTYDYVVVLEPTSPLTESADVDAAIGQLHGALDRADAIVGVTHLETIHPAFCVKRGAGGVISPYGNASFDNLPRRQDLEAVFALDGSLYISTVAAIHARRSFCHDRTLGFVTQRHQALEVDDLVDFLCIEAVMAHRHATGGAQTGSSHRHDS